MKSPTPNREQEGCEFCGMKENCNNYKLGIKQGQLSQKEKDIRIVRLIPAIRFVNGKRLVDKDKIIEQIQGDKE